MLPLLCLKNSQVPLYIATWCIASCVLSSNALKSLIIASGCFPSRQFWGPMNAGFAYDWENTGAARSTPEARTLHAAALFSQCWARAWRLSSLILKQRMRRWKVNTCGRYLRLCLEAFQPTWGFVVCACSCLSARYCCKAQYGRICYTQWDIEWIFGQLKSSFDSLLTSIAWLFESRQAFISRRFSHGIHGSAFLSLSTFRCFMSSVLRALALAFAFLPAHPSKKTSLNVRQLRKATSM